LWSIDAMKKITQASISSRRGSRYPNRSARPAKLLEIGSSDARDRCVYSDIDMTAEPGVEVFSRRDGSFYP
jgi:uncharacterized cupin superfamily protein